MSLNESAAAAVNKKVTSLDTDFARFATRATLAGVYLTIGTAFAGVAANVVDKHAEGVCSLVFAFLFGLGLFSIIILNTDLATGNMMYGVYGAVTGQISWGKAFKLIIVTTLFNLVGALLFAFLVAQAGKFADMDANHFIPHLTEGKMQKSPLGMLIEGVLANFVVNMAIVGAVFAKDLASKFWTIVPIIAMFVVLGLEHVIANFSLVSITLFASDTLPAHVDAAHILTNWVIVWIGNLIGGGFLIGGVYAWLNRGNEAYRD